MNDLIKVNKQGEQVVSGRRLHKFLGVHERYNDWINRMLEYGFEENIDYMGFTEKTVKPKGGRPSKDHILTLDMAKEDNGFSFPCSWAGAHLKINRIGLERWLLERADGHFDFTEVCLVILKKNR